MLPFVAKGRPAWQALLCGLVLSLCAPLAWGASSATSVDAPKIPPVARVTDLTGTLSPAQQRHIARQLAALENAKGAQLALLMIPSTQPLTIEQYGIRVADQWKLGRKGVDDGLIFLIAKQDHRVRLEVGYGLEGIVPDATANEIIDRFIVPHFRTGDFYGGIEAGLGALTKIIGGSHLPPPGSGAQRQRRAGSASGFIGPLGVAAIALFMMMFVGKKLYRRFGLRVAAIGVGAGTGVIVGLLTMSLLMAVFSGLGALVLAFAMFTSGGGRGGGGLGGPMLMGGLMGFGLGGLGRGFGGGLGGGGLGGFGGLGGGFGGGGASGGW